MFSKAGHYKTLFPHLKIVVEKNYGLVQTVWFDEWSRSCSQLAISVPRDLLICDLEQENAATENEEINRLQNNLVEIVLYVYPEGF